jgi:hypothetical protein
MTDSQAIQWKRLVAEGAAIIASILLAFGIDAAWSDRQEQRQEQVFLSSLLADFIDTRDRIQANLGAHDSFRQSAIELIDVAEVHATGVDLETVETLLLDVFFYAKTLNVSNGSLDSLLASGSLSSISNDKLREMLAIWPSRIDDVAEDEVWILTDIQERTVPYLNSAVPTRNILARAPENANFITVTASGDYSVLWDDPTFINLVSYRIHTETTVIDQNTELADLTEEIIEYIEAELAQD